MRRVSAGGQRAALFAPGADFRLTHQPGYPFAGGSTPLIFQFSIDTRASISALVCEKHLPDCLRQLSIFSGALAGRALAPGIKATFRDSKDIAHDHDGKCVLVLFNKLLFHLESREKMLTTFFRISRSC